MMATLRRISLFCWLLSAQLSAQAPSVVPAPAASNGLPDSGQTTPQRTTGTVSMEARCVGLPSKLALPLIRELRADDPALVQGAMKKLDDLILKGPAKLYDLLLLIGKSGQRSVAENTEEVMYPTDFEAAAVNIELSRNAEDVVVKEPSGVKGADKQPIASSFTSRNIGTTLDAEPVVAPDGSSIEINLQMRHIRLKSIDRFTIEQANTAEQKSEKVIQEQPRFTEMKVTTSLTVKSGEPRLIGTFRSAEDKDELELFIVTGEYLAPAKPTPPSSAKQP